ncbi:transcription elongation factor S-II [Xylaria telfairii]|nr:transcription elongation factor S-II [Xylaria telfairii]
MPALARAELLAAATAFCDSIAQGKPLDEIMSHFASTPDVVVHEHGLPRLAPFLGRDFCGAEGVREYFETVGRCLRFEDTRFVEFIADEGVGDGAGKVAVRGKVRLTSTETGQSWDETFVYILRFDETGKVVRYDVWADTGAAYLAGRGELGKDGT